MTSRERVSDEDVSAERLAVLFEQRYDPLVRLAALLGAPPGRAEELVMDAFAALAPRLDSVDNPAAYLRTTVLNGVRSHHRRLRTVRNQPRPRARPVEDPEIDELWDRLGSLSAAERTCMVLRYYEDLSLAGIAEVLDMPLGTVKSHLHRGMASLRDLLAATDPVAGPTEEDRP